MQGMRHTESVQCDLPRLSDHKKSQNDFHQHGPKVFTDVQLWILVYSSFNQGTSFPLRLWASERLLKGSL